MPIDPPPSSASQPSALHPGAARWARLSSTAMRGFHRYANWLVSISWRLFAVLAILLVIGASILEEVPPFSWRFSRVVEVQPKRAPTAPKPPAAAPAEPAAPEAPASVDPRPDKGVKVTIGKDGVRVTHAGETTHPREDVVIDIQVEPGGKVEGVKQAVIEAIEEARRATAEADAEEDADTAADVASARSQGRTTRIERVRIGDFLTDLAMLWVLASAVIKITYKGQLRAEAQAAQATETADAESLKRQVIEARLAAMQAQVEPHFLFNTLASIDHLIETDPPRASRMQKNLIAMLRASMPGLRDTPAAGQHDVGRELAVIRPYLEILKVRMDDRLGVSLQVPEGLLSAEFPPMVLQSIVENAIKHGLEPKPEGGTLTVRAEVAHGKLVVAVADTGLGFGLAATAGSGTGLANIRERLSLLYGPRATLAIAATPGGGTTVTVTLPYKPVEGGHSA